MKNLTNAYSVRITFRFILFILLILLLTSNITIVGGETTNSEDNINKQIQDENIDDKISDYAEQDYSGIYYLHDDLPEHGQDIGNTHDVGDLQREKPHGYEERYCAKWVQFDFDEHVFGEIIFGGKVQMKKQILVLSYMVFMIQAQSSHILHHIKMLFQPWKKMAIG
jgi:hypothetical protein